MDITDFVKGPKEEGVELKYDLYAVSNHRGSMTSGHYWTYAKSPLDQKWREFNDSSVTDLHVKGKSDWNKVVTDKA